MKKSINVSDDKENITNPFSSKDIKITNVTIALSSLINRLKYEEIDLNPDFQRNNELWNNKQMSRLIESILLKLPLPIFYFDVSNPDKWVVVDGLQRLSTLQKFIIDEKLKLKELEFLKDLKDYKYTDLDRSLKRVIDETQILSYQIEAQTPKEVRYSIFNRINTGGINLNAQEVRQALNQKGNGVTFLKEISEAKIFKDIVDVSSKRMADRTLILRFMAFHLIDEVNYMDKYLDKAMEELDSIQKEEDLNTLKQLFLKTLTFSEEILGENHRFSRSIAIEKQSKTLNRSIFDVITVCFSKMDENEKDKLREQKEIFREKFINLLKNEQSSFSKAITEGSNGKNAIERRFKIMNNLIREILNEN